MSYPSQPGYPTPQYGQRPPGQQQNNLWLIGGTVVIILVIIMTVVLLVVQQSAGTDSGDGGDGGETGGENTGGDEESDYEDLPAGEFNSDSCNMYELSKFEEVTGDTVDPESNSHSFSSYESYDNVSCYFYTSENFYSLNVSLYDYETAEEVVSYIDYDAETYDNNPDYEFAEYNEYGDAGTIYSLVSDPSYQSTYLHVALGSLETRISMTYNANEIDVATVTTALEDVLMQTDVIFADVK